MLELNTKCSKVWIHHIVKRLMGKQINCAYNYCSKSNAIVYTLFAMIWVQELHVITWLQMKCQLLYTIFVRIHFKCVNNCNSRSNASLNRSIGDGSERISLMALKLLLEQSREVLRLVSELTTHNFTAILGGLQKVDAWCISCTCVRCFEMNEIFRMIVFFFDLMVFKY